MKGFRLCPYANNCPFGDYGSEEICRDEYEFCDWYIEFKLEEQQALYKKEIEKIKEISKYSKTKR